MLIIGGGLAGLSLSLQLRQQCPDLAVMVLEKRIGPAPEATHKVGESTVELAAHYFANVLGLRSLLHRNHLPKYGLRFYFTEGDNRDIGRRSEVGPFGAFNLPSFQIDRGRFENELRAETEALGTTVLEGVRVTDVEIGAATHRLTARTSKAGAQTFRGRWIVDASGRSHLLKRRLGLLETAADHAINAAWFRVNGVVDIDSWSDAPEFRVAGHQRALATNHLCGAGYWVWLIPLGSGSTSIGIVADPRFHPLERFNSEAKALAWLDEFEPQCADRIREQAPEIQDFLALRHYSHRAQRVFSHERFALTGDAGMFADPLYSPGSDFVAINNTFLTALIQRDLEGASIDGLSAAYDRIYRSLYEGFLAIYRDQYGLLGNPEVMAAKIIWDFAVYWGGICPLFFHGQLTDPLFMAGVQNDLQLLREHGRRMVELFARWNARPTPPRRRWRVDYHDLDFLQRFHLDLLRNHDGASLSRRLGENVEVLGCLADEMERHVDPAAALPDTERHRGIRRELEKVWPEGSSAGNESAVVAWQRRRPGNRAARAAHSSK